MSGSSAELDPLELLTEAFLEELRQGLSPSVDEYARQHPELADRIHELFPALLALEAVPPSAALGPAVPVGRLPPERLGEYRLLGELGRGGMGVVYEAVHETLGRHVALKVLPFNELADPVHLERFRREARAAAKLHHSNIVPVFDVGQHDGIHYFAMQFIRGQSLEAVLHEVKRLREPQVGPGDPTPRPPGEATARLGAPTAPPPSTAAKPALPSGEAELSTQAHGRYYRSVARLGVQAAAALQYAHQHGILHRDVKPANLLLDAEGTLWVADFGLAKLKDGDGLTGTEDLVGTLRFMAPERFQGKTDARSDTYSLGVTLYEMLTLRPAFDAADRAGLMERIRHDEPVPPRRLDRRIPRDLETVVLKAMARAPAARYATAADLAADLQRFLDDRPVRARRTRPWERLAKWVKRRPLVALLLGLLAVTVGLLLGLMYQRIGEQQAALDGLAAEQAKTQQASRRAEENFAEALGTVEELMADLGEEKLRGLPDLEQLQRQVYEKVLQRLHALLARKDNDPKTRHALAIAYARVAVARVQLGHLGGGEQAARRAVALCRRLRDESPDQPVFATLLAITLYRLGETLHMAAKPREAEEVYRQGVEWARRQAAEMPTEPLPRLRLAALLTGHARALRDLGRFAEAKQDCRAAESLLQGLDAKLARQPAVTYLRADTAHTLGTAYFQTGHFAEAEGRYRRALRLLEPLVAASPGASNYRLLLAGAWNDLGTACAFGQKDAAAREAFRKAEGHYAKLVADFPGRPLYRAGLALALLKRASLDDRHPERSAETVRELRRAVGLLETLVKEVPRDVAARDRLATACANLGAALLKAQAPPAEAGACYRRGLALRVQLVKEFPNSFAFRVELAGLHWNLGELKECRRLLEQTLARHGALTPARRAAVPRETVKAAYLRLAQALVRLGEHEEADRRAEEWVGHFPDSRRTCVEAALCLLGCAVQAEKDGRLTAGQRRTAATGYADRSTALLRAALGKGGADDRGRPQHLLRLLRAIPNLDSLRTYPNFQRLLRELEGAAPL